MQANSRLYVCKIQHSVSRQNSYWIKCLEVPSWYKRKIKLRSHVTQCLCFTMPYVDPESRPLWENNTGNLVYTWGRAPGLNHLANTCYVSVSFEAILKDISYRNGVCRRQASSEERRLWLTEPEKASCIEVQRIQNSWPTIMDWMSNPQKVMFWNSTSCPSVVWSEVKVCGRSFGCCKSGLFMNGVIY